MIKNDCLKLKRFCLILCAIFLTLSCGKRTPPQPPTRIPSPPLSGYQRGSSIILSWQVPTTTQKIEIYRLIESKNNPPTITEEEFKNRSTLIASLSAPTSQYQDKLIFVDQPIRIYYALRFTNKTGQKSVLSEVFSIEPSTKIPLPPQLLKITVTQDKITLTWTPPEKNIDDSKPAKLIGYNVYKIENGNQKLLNSSPIQQNYFDDIFFEFEKEYKYFVRSVTISENAETVESENSNTLEIKPKDTFPPSPPEGVTIAASQNAISIFFAVNKERDVIGYLIFRSENPALPIEQWQKITPEPLTTNTFQDKQVKSGKTYFYFIRAVDKFGNISAPSEIVNETLP
ncbi:MAG: hypothetical protein N2Z23_11155 [Pyrinomonadaceae bacterium]|nr:hypothetical protein [Pyrinomonadaceae bacterium]MDW8305093.1 hypothetical protein [Acidobacteriota bacterium]